MRGDPFVVVICDGCEDEEIEATLTPLAGNSFDMRGVDGQLKRAGWSTNDGKDYCSNCVEMAAANEKGSEV